MTATRILTGAIYFDDSGNPGAQSGSDFLPSSRKAWTAVIVPSPVAEKVQEGMEIFLNGIRGEFRVDELHFTEIYSGKGLWKTVAVDERAKIIGLMSRLIGAFDLPIVHQSVSEFTRADHPVTGRPFRSGDWDTADLSHFGLLLLCSEVCRRLRVLRNQAPENFKLPFPLYADEGILPAGRNRALPNWADGIEGPEVRFRNSVDVPGLQLADFAAFIINRTQWIAATRVPGRPITMAEQVILDASANLNVLNFELQSIPIEEFGRAGYEERLSADRVAKGLPPRPGSTK
ncbi:DUF3800 domain-containing protein [Rhizobium bangladeshense]|uniref:DUF3800 domain-containing protein n=1 Tax=Rhizobium bangladeshense TaxID=1138189 RepID=UPI001C836878|nr:DUF3800 domain-containing protein [Rhizobium bangladeshense]MBX4922348.1 DUF3800 domain-containing protein [Rhizobium bangladeshense]MBY3599306.1 DUF3800 domain-containing protein [Rhizobium bangladeshense]